MTTEQERAAGRRWLEWADDTGNQVIRAAELRAQGFGEVDMRTLLHMAFQAGAHAQWVADLEAKASIRAECEQLREALAVYGDPGFWFGVSWAWDRPTGGFDEDFSTDHGHDLWPDEPMPGKHAREVLLALAGEPR